MPVLGCLPLSAANRMLLLHQFSGFHSCSGSRLEGICVCVCVFFFFISCFVCVFVVVVVAQFTHSRPVMLDLPSLQQLSDPPTRRQSEQTRNKQGTETFQSVFRETCYFKGSIEVPLELITVVGEIRQGGSCSVGSQEMEKAEKGKKKESLQEVQFSYFLNYQLYISIRDKEINLAPSVVPKSHLFQWIAH